MSFALARVEVDMQHVLSRDGTSIAYASLGAGPPLVMVMGAFNDHSTGAELATALATRFCVVVYDRRGRGASTDTRPYSVPREIDDLAAVLSRVGGATGTGGADRGGGADSAVGIAGTAGLAAPLVPAVWIAAAGLIVRLVLPDRWDWRRRLRLFLRRDPGAGGRRRGPAHPLAGAVRRALRGGRSVGRRARWIRRRSPPGWQRALQRG